MVLIWDAWLSSSLILEGGESRVKSCLGWQTLTLRRQSLDSPVDRMLSMTTFATVGTCFVYMSHRCVLDCFCCILSAHLRLRSAVHYTLLPLALLMC